jgi:hypothetical protein
VAEEFGLNELGGDGGAIQRDEGVFVAWRLFVDGACNEFFAGAGFAKDADAGFAGGDAINLREEFGHCRARTHELVLAETVAEFTVLVLEAREFESVFYSKEQLIGGERLFEEIESAETRGFDSHFDVGLAGDQNNGSLQARFFEFFEEFHAGFAGHDDVGEDEVEALGLQEFGGTLRVIADGGFMSGQAESASERGKGVGVVVDEEEMSFAWHGGPFGRKWRDSGRFVDRADMGCPPRSTAPLRNQVRPKSTARNG